MFSSCSSASSVSTYGIGWSLMVFCFLVRRTAPRQPVCCGGFFSTIQFSNISSDLRYRSHHKMNRSISQSTLTKRSSYFHIRWLWHFPKVKHYPISGLVGKESTRGNAVHNQSQARCLMGKLPIGFEVAHTLAHGAYRLVMGSFPIIGQMKRRGLLMRNFRITHRGLLRLSLCDRCRPCTQNDAAL